MDAGHINDSEERELVPGYGTIAIGKVQEDNRTILGDITPKGRQRYIIYVPSSCKENLPAGSKVMFDKQAVSVEGLDLPPIEIAVNVRSFNPDDWYRQMKEMEEQPHGQH